MQRRHDSPEWREFEQLVARIEHDAGPLGLVVRSPDRILCKVTGRKREVDVSVRSRAGTADLLVTIECRKRHPKQDVTWIEQLATKRDAIGASCTIAVSSSGFTPAAEAVAARHGIRLRRLSEISVDEVNGLLRRLDFVLFTHKRAAAARVGLRFYRDETWKVPDPNQVDMDLPSSTDLFAKIFTNTETGYAWSIIDMWHQVQKDGDAFGDVKRGQPPVIRNACFPYPGNVRVETPDGPKRLGDAILSIKLWIELEEVWLNDAKRVEYASPEGEALQRVEFVPQRREQKDWSISLQVPKDSTDLNELKTGFNQPTPESAK
ncbi:restriction endonuclease [Bryobacter aggregatus]|uniref:restriction endonuclease n=1 Tax=Bryobacter aggregatus TaxID=360054 RepID=UPI0004E0CDA5|nr:restriction endonuclease [Bryobacter aggregatus]